MFIIYINNNNNNTQHWTIDNDDDDWKWIRISKKSVPAFHFNSYYYIRTPPEIKLRFLFHFFCLSTRIKKNHDDPFFLLILILFVLFFVFIQFILMIIIWLIDRFFLKILNETSFLQFFFLYFSMFDWLIGIHYRTNSTWYQSID